MTPAPFNRIFEIKYMSDDTGEVIEFILMREFYEWAPVNKKTELVRHYPLSQEALINPGFGNPPQGEAAFPANSRGGALI
jgi:hypothetical protein